MSKEQATLLVQRYYAAFNKLDANTMIECVSDDIFHDVNQGGRREGKVLFRDFCAHMDECYSEQLKDMVIMVSKDGQRAAAEFTVHGIYKRTDEGLPPAKGQKYVLPAGAFLEIRDGKITRVTTYYNLQEWIRQVEAV